MPRNEQIREWRKNHSLTWIANKVQLSPERVRQICLDTGDKNQVREEILSKYKELLNETGHTQLLEEIIELSKPDREQDSVMKRQELIRYLHDKLGLSFFKISLLLRRHHTSVLSLYKKEISNKELREFLDAHPL